MKEYKIAIYLRLSSADDKIGKGKEESSSIISQRGYINNYLDNYLSFRNAQKIEYIDDGYSGTNDRRPSFLKMIEDAKAGKINLIIVKDCSRFFRDYIEAGNYFECIFPLLKVRFISINDNYDSENYKGTAGSLDLAMKNIIYGAYSKDISIKSKSARKLKMREGKFVGSHAPFGYIKHPEIQNKLAIDTDSAATVRYIFDLALNGNNTSLIAKKLNEEKRLTPAEYYKQKFPNDKKFSFTANKTVWTSAQVYLILTNLRYTGTLVSNRKEKVSLSENIYKKVQPIIVEGTHEAIVTKNEFDKANLVITKRKILKQRIPQQFLLKSKVRCYNCKRLMKRKQGAKGKFYFTCAYTYSDKQSACPKGKTFFEGDLEKLVLNSLNKSIEITQEQNKNKKFDKQMIKTFIKSIYIIDNQRVEIKFNFNDIFGVYMT